MTACPHSSIHAWVFEDTREHAGLWSCVHCATKFYPADRVHTIEQQRDDLLAALQNLIAWHDADHNDSRGAIDAARAVIASITGDTHAR